MIAQIASSRRLTFVRALWTGWVVVGLVVSSLIVWNAQRERADILEKTQLHAQAAADVAAAQVERLFQSATFAVNLMVDEVGADWNWDRISQSKVVWDKARHWVSQSSAVPRVILTDEQGTVRLFTDQFPPPPVSLADRQYFADRRAAADFNFIIGEPIIGKVSRKALIPLVRRLEYPDRRFAGVAMANTEPDTLAHFFRSIELGNNSHVTLLRTDGTVMVRYPELTDVIGRRLANPPMLSSALANQGPGAGLALSPIDGKVRMSAYRWVSGVNGVIIAGIDLGEELAGWRRGIWRAVGIAGGAMAAFALLLGQFIRRFNETKDREALLAVRVQLSETALHGTLDELLGLALDAAERLTESQIGFFHFVDPDQENLTLQQWSTNTLRHMCTAEGKGHHYPISQAGVWVQCVATRKPIIHNDYAHLPDKHGLPDGHAPVVRELTVPILRNDRVMAIIGVGNKPTDYIQKDVEAVEQIASMTIDLAERKRSEAEEHRLNERLKATIDELSESNRELARFAQVAAHDLQEPTRSLVAYAQLVQRRLGDGLDSETHQYLETIVAAATRMRELVQDVLAYSRLSDKAEVFVPVPMRRVVDIARKHLAAAIAESRAVIEVGELPVIMGHEGQMVQLVQNLLGNAIKFRRPETVPRVRIEAARQGDEWLFTVADNGIGIDPKYHQQIFVIFQRLHSRQVYSGTGIGLAICARIVASHGGRIWVESSSDQGARFHFTLRPAIGDQNRASSEGSNPEARANS